MNVAPYTDEITQHVVYFSDAEIETMSVAHPYALALLCHLRARYELYFPIPNDMSTRIQSSRRRFMTARNYLIGTYIEQVRPPTALNQLCIVGLDAVIDLMLAIVLKT